MKTKSLVTFIFAFVLGLGWSLAWADDGRVHITPLGQKTGDFCRADRALILEDPDGTRVLYDAGRTVAGATDDRLGNIDVVLLSSVHSDHIGVGKLNQDPDAAGAICNPNPPLASTPNSNTAEIIAGFPASKSFLGGEMRDFMRAKVAAEGGSTAQVDVLRHGGKRILGGVTIAVVPAHHSNGDPRQILTSTKKGDGIADILAADRLTAYVGPENGYVLTFSNGLAVYLSGDTGQTADMAMVVRDFYNAKVAVVNMGDIFSMGPEEAAFATNSLIKPQTVIPSHANQASTTGGVVNPGTRLETFIGLVGGAKVIVPLSGVPISCDGAGNCN